MGPEITARPRSSGLCPMCGAARDGDEGCECGVGWSTFRAFHEWQTARAAVVSDEVRDGRAEHQLEASLQRAVRGGWRLSTAFVERVGQERMAAIVRAQGGLLVRRRERFGWVWVAAFPGWSPSRPIARDPDPHRNAARTARRAANPGRVGRPPKSLPAAA